MSRILRSNLSTATSELSVADEKCGRTRRALSRATREDAQAFSILEREEKAVLGVPEELHPDSLFEARDRYAETQLVLDEARIGHISAKAERINAKAALAQVNAEIKLQLSSRLPVDAVAFASA